MNPCKLFIHVLFFAPALVHHVVPQNIYSHREESMYLIKNARLYRNKIFEWCIRNEEINFVVNPRHYQLSKSRNPFAPASCVIHCESHVNISDKTFCHRWTKLSLSLLFKKIILRRSPESQTQTYNTVLTAGTSHSINTKKDTENHTNLSLSANLSTQVDGFLQVTQN